MAELTTVTANVATAPTVGSLELTVARTNGVLNVNFDEINKSLDEFLDGYRIIQYSSDADKRIKQLRQDHADLNKLSAAIKGTKKEVKEQFMAPLNTFNEEVDKLLAKIEEPKQVIHEKVKELEEAGREEKRKNIRDYYDSISSEVDADFKEELYKRLYNTSWENATATQKAYKDGLSKGVENFVYGMKCLKLSNHEFLDDGLREFKLSLDLTKAIELMEEKQKQKEELLRKEQERLEAERKRIEEEAEAEAQRKIDEANAEAQRKIEEATKKAEEEAQKKIDASLEKMVAETEKTIKAAVEKATAEIEAKVQTQDSPSPVVSANTNVIDRTARVQVTPLTMPRVDLDAPVVITPVVDTPATAGKVVVEFETTGWELVQKYADRMGVNYTVKC